MSTVLVTGAAGLLGNNLVRLLVERGFAVRGYEHPAANINVLDGLPIEWIRGDLCQPGSPLHQAVKGVDAVFHCAAITDLRAPKDLAWDVNLEGTRAVLHACEEYAIDRLVFVGSASSFAFGSREAPGTESSPFPRAYNGLNYMESKYAALQLVRQTVAEKKLDIVTVAPTFMLGPHDPRPSSGELIMRFVNQKLRFASPGGRNFAHVVDVATAMINALEKGKSGECYLLGGHNIDYLEFFAAVAKATGLPAPLGKIPTPLIRSLGVLGSTWQAISRRQVLLDRTIARLACYRTFYDSAKAIRELNMPLSPLQTGIQDSINSLVEYGHINISSSSSGDMT